MEGQILQAAIRGVKGKMSIRIFLLYIHPEDLTEWTQKALNYQQRRKIAEMVKGSGGGKYPSITAVQRREATLDYCYHSSKEAGDGVVRGSGPCARRGGVQLVLAV
jgi:hypothetical protein